MKIYYDLYTSFPDEVVITEINRINAEIFSDGDDLFTRMKSKPKLLIVIAVNNNRIVGYKMGYEIDSDKFYSWLGGVDPNFRKHGIASELLNKQHDYLIQKGYKAVQTKTTNTWKGMLILNIKNGFDVKSTYTDDKGVHKIILEKKL